jgi:hypothetical protein
MPTVDRMFRVIVAGGIALSATAPGLVVGCGGSIGTLPGDGGRGADSFPSEGPPPQQADAFPQETAQQVDGFPQEGFYEGDTGIQVVDSGVGPDVFPQEGPNVEAGSFDAAGQPEGFPFETASP